MDSGILLNRLARTRLGHLAVVIGKGRDCLS